MEWKKELRAKFERDELRRLISNVNWIIFKPKIKKQLEILSTQLSGEHVRFNIIDMQDEPDGYGYGFDCLTFQIADRMTGNMRQEKTTESIKFNHHWQKGAALSITYSATGAVHIILFPSTSDDSLATHDSLIVHHSYNVKHITPKKIEKAVKNLLHYHRVTGVLHKAALKDLILIRLLKIKMFFIQYNDKENKFRRVTALYIPTLSLIVSLAAAVASILALVSVKS
ncbi:hypothetical protein [Escherichia coli]|uniref:hypothetical protein n=3 Tax=Escherichia coli TaxID=562 RepID=UPI00202338A3|nr:hypothetical protein [Escherichia coli]